MLFGSGGRKDSAWRSRYPETATCIRCLEEKDVEELDRLLWCESCVAAARRRATTWGWVGGAVLAVALALWIWLHIHPSDLVIGGWIATVAATLWLGAKVVREIAFGVMRFRNRKATDATPPTDPGS